MNAKTCTACTAIQTTLGQGVQCNRCRKSNPNAMTTKTFEATRLMREGASVKQAERVAFGK